MTSANSDCKMVCVIQRFDTLKTEYGNPPTASELNDDGTTNLLKVVSRGKISFAVNKDLGYTFRGSVKCTNNQSVTKTNQIYIT